MQHLQHAPVRQLLPVQFALVRSAARIFLVYPDDEQGMKRAKEVNDRMIQLALKMGGSCSGEHGIGIGKIDMLRQQHGEGVAVMKAIKQALDPGNILNPTKVLG